MSGTLAAALRLSLTSLVVTFLALALFALIIVILRSVFSARPDGLQPPRASARDQSDEELAAAIGLALHLSASGTSLHGDSLGRALAEGPGPYWAGGSAAETFSGSETP